MFLINFKLVPCDENILGFLHVLKNYITSEKQMMNLAARKLRFEIFIIGSDSLSVRMFNVEHY